MVEQYGWPDRPHLAQTYRTLVMVVMVRSVRRLKKPACLFSEVQEAAYRCDSNMPFSRGDCIRIRILRISLHLFSSFMTNCTCVSSYINDARDVTRATVNSPFQFICKNGSPFYRRSRSHGDFFVNKACPQMYGTDFPFLTQLLDECVDSHPPRAHATLGSCFTTRVLHNKGNRSAGLPDQQARLLCTRG